MEQLGYGQWATDIIFYDVWVQTPRLGSYLFPLLTEHLFTTKIQR